MRTSIKLTGLQYIQYVSALAVNYGARICCKSAATLVEFVGAIVGGLGGFEGCCLMPFQVV